MLSQTGWRENLDVRAEAEQGTPQVYRPFRMWVCFLLRVAANRGLIGGISEREGAIRRGAEGR